MKSEWNDYTVPKQKLPCCGYEIDTVAQTSGDDIGNVDDLRVGSHAVSVCMQCGQWLVINLDLSQRLVTAEDILQMPDEVREHLRDMTRAVHIVRARHQ